MSSIKITKCARHGIKHVATSFSLQRGFTLLELMIVVAIIGIIAAIAYPAYNSQVMKSQRTDAKSSLLTAAHTLERCYTEYNAYDNAACPALSTTSSEGYYSIAVSTLTANSYILTATPASGLVVDDTACTTLTLDNKGVKASTGGGDCW